MNRKVVYGTMLALLAAFVLIGAAAAHGGGRPPEPECPLATTDTITVTPAQWVNEVPAVTHKEHRHFDWQHWTWGPWTQGPKHGSSVEERTVTDAPAIPAHWTDPVCRAPVGGCMDRLALNFNPEAEVDDGSCQYPPEPVYGCTDDAALNYNPEATVDDGSCQYPPDPVPGCMDEAALNFNPLATVDDQSCEYAPVCEDETALNFGQEGECQYPEPTPAPPKCGFVKQNYGFAELWSSSGEYATMYIYPDENGNLPAGVGVERQLCVLGWQAVHSGVFDFVYKDTCTGEYFFNGKEVTPRADVLKFGVCQRGGACVRE